VNKAHTNDLNKMIYLDSKKLMITCAGDKTIKFWRYPFDAKEKIIQKVIDQSGKVISSTDPSQQYQIQKKEEVKRNNKNDDSDEEEDDDSEPRGPLTLLNYQPALELDSEEDEEKPKKPVQKTANVVKKSESTTTENKTKPAAAKNKKALFDDEDEDNEDDDGAFKTVGKSKDTNQASPKSFLFKNSLDSSAPVKKEEIKKPAAPVVKKEIIQSGTNDPLGFGKGDDKETKKPVWTAKPKQPAEKEPLEKHQPQVQEPIKVAPKEQDDDDKPLNFEELKKTSDYVPLTFKKKDDESEDEELSGWNS